MTKLYKHTTYVFDMESRYAAEFFNKEQHLQNFCGRVVRAIPEIKSIKLVRSNEGMHCFEFNIECDYYGNDLHEASEIWGRLFLFYMDYVRPWHIFKELHADKWHEQEVFDPEDHIEYRKQQDKKVFLGKLKT